MEPCGAVFLVWWLHQFELLLCCHQSFYSWAYLEPVTELLPPFCICDLPLDALAHQLRELLRVDLALLGFATD